jgi:hypothetical protein
VERVNQTLMNKLKKITAFGKYSWEKALPRATFAVNISFNRAIGMAPYMLKYGETPKLEVDLKLGAEDKIGAKEELIRLRKKNFSNYATQGIEKGKIQAKYDLKIGDPVLIYKEPLKDKFSKKWWPGFVIKEIIEPAAYIVKNSKTEFRLNKAHVKLDESQKGRGDVVNVSSIDIKEFT